MSGCHRKAHQPIGASSGSGAAYRQKFAVNKRSEGPFPFAPLLSICLVVIVLLLVLAAITLLIAGAIVILLLSAVLVALVILAVAAVLAVLILVVVLHDSHLTAVSMPSLNKFLAGLRRKI